MKVRVEVSAEKIPDFVSWRIMRRLKFEGSHIFIVLPEDDMIAHCVDRGVCFDSYSEFLKEHHIVHSKEVELMCERAEFHDWMNGHIGRKIEYSMSQYWGFVLPFVKPFFRNRREKAICSEFVAWVLTDFAGYSNLDDSDFLSPKDVWAAVSGEK